MVFYCALRLLVAVELVMSSSVDFADEMLLNMLVKMMIRPCKSGLGNALGPILGGHIPEGECAFFFPPVSLRYN